MWFDAPVRDTPHRSRRPGRPSARCSTASRRRKFVRSRYLEYQDEDGEWHADPTADLGRITRQQVFVRRADRQGRVRRASATRSRSTSSCRPASPTSASTSTSTPATCSASGRAFAEFDSDDLIGYSIPTRADDRRPPAPRCELPADAPGAERPHRVPRPAARHDHAPRAVDVTVLNGTGVTGQAADAAGALGRSASTSSTSTRSPTTRTSPAPPCSMATGTSRRRPLASSPAHHRRRRARARPVDGRVRSGWSSSPAPTSRPSTTSPPPRARPTMSAPPRTTVATEGSEPSGGRRHDDDGARDHHDDRDRLLHRRAARRRRLRLGREADR